MVNIEFLEELWRQGHKSDHPLAGDVMKEWCDAGLVKDVVHSSPIFQREVSVEQLSGKEYGEALLLIVSELEKNLTKSGPHRKDSWEKGWEDSLRGFVPERAEESLSPGYFESSKYLRLANTLFRVESGKIEATLLGLLVDLVVNVTHKLYGFQNIHEFGCGTGIHVRRLAKLFPGALVTGYDWAKSSQKIVEAIRTGENLENLRARNFDFFQPDSAINLDKEDLVLTVAALEQTGPSFGLFLDMLISKRPKVVVNIEPIEELLDTSTELGLLSARYFRKRRYLEGYFQALIHKQEQGAIEVLHSGRSGVGSLYIEGYSVVVWRPVP